MPVFAHGLNVGLVGFRYMWVVGPKTAMGGQLLVRARRKLAAALGANCKRKTAERSPDCCVVT